MSPLSLLGAQSYMVGINKKVLNLGILIKFDT
jgi:hypothetical protein